MFGKQQDNETTMQSFHSKKDENDEKNVEKE